MTDSDNMVAEKYGFEGAFFPSSFDRARKFRAGLQDVLNAYRKSVGKRVRLSSQACCRVPSLPATPVMVQDEPQPPTRRQAGVEGVGVSDLPALWVQMRMAR